MAERTHLLSEDGQAAVERMQRAVQRVPALRAARPAAALGTWLEQAWLALGGAACVDATARENLDLLWSCLDGLPQGELDLHGSALDTALEDLKALPDRGVGSECGVQLMTIHKSKGLEFEVVIVPDLQARAAHTRGKLLSWLERGLERGMESGAAEPEEPTEFLIAPMPTKGAAGGAAKNWVDCVYKARESQEMRRLLYVAATRAREEVHLFARPEYKEERDGARKLTEPGNSLLATAWPAVEAEVQERFDAWNAPRDAEVEAIAAVAELEARQHTAEHFAMVQRLPAAYRNPDAATAGADMAGADMAGHGPETDVTGMRQLYERHEGGIESRVLGVGVHALMQQMAQLRETLEWDGVRRGLRGWMPRVAAQIRAAGMDATRAERMASRVVELAFGAGEDAVGRWILSPHTDAESEARWAGVVEGRLRTVQVDRVFRAGAEPLEEDGDVWWIIDYKTAGEDGAEAKTLPELRERFRGQVEAYARVLRNLRGADARIHGGLYYPRMPGFDWWEIGG
jgi:ATP-dependent exoDNAse (exonuclease V) beta subunit